MIYETLWWPKNNFLKCQKDLRSFFFKVLLESLNRVW